MTMDLKRFEKFVMALELDPKLSEIQRAAHLLEQVAREFPFKMVPTNWIVRKALCLTRTPGEDTEMVTAFKKRMSAVRVTLDKNKPKLGLVAGSGFGFRATVPDDWNDYFIHSVVRAARRAGKGNDRFQSTITAIPPDKLSPENRKQYWEYKKVAKQLKEGNVVNALLAENENKSKTA